MSTHIDRNQTIVSHLKNISSGKSENDFTPQKQTAFKQVQALTSTMEDRSGSLNDDMEQLKELLQNFGGSKTETKLIASLSKKIDDQLAEMTKLGDAIQGSSTLDSGATTDEGDSEGDESSSDDTVNPTSTTTVNHISISSGSQVIASRILLELQQKYAELQQILQTILKDNLSHSTGIVQALANAASDSLMQDANNQKLEMGTYIAGAVTSGLSLGTTVKYGRDSDAESRTIQDEQQTLDLHEKDLQGVARAHNTISDAPPMIANPNLPTGRPARLMKQYQDKLKNNQFDPERPNSTRAQKQARLDAYEHLTPSEKATVAKNLNEKITQKSNQLSAVQTKYSRKESMVSTGNQVLNSSIQSWAKGSEAGNTQKKAADEAQRTTSQNSTENLNSTLSQSRENVSQAQQQSGQVLKVRESIIQNNTAGK